MFFLTFRKQVSILESHFFVIFKCSQFGLVEDFDVCKELRVRISYLASVSFEDW